MLYVKVKLEIVKSIKYDTTKKELKRAARDKNQYMLIDYEDVKEYNFTEKEKEP